ncbi:MAG TPA: roadblock/LC7 domain-containing protein [Thermoplasmata archaeon]|nr:roadblock/LC7 domain-containing protein [Thermoplasmata archaeon]
MAARNVGALLGDLKNRIGAIATALVSRNGLVVHAEMPSGGHAETFAVMCATILGAAATARSEVGRTPPERIVVEGGGSQLIMVPAGRQALLVAAVDESTELRAVVDEVARFADLLATS